MCCEMTSRAVHAYVPGWQRFMEDADTWANARQLAMPSAGGPALHPFLTLGCALAPFPSPAAERKANHPTGLIAYHLNLTGPAMSALDLERHWFLRR